MAVTNIRKGIFETNSSSVHVLCINKMNNNVTIPDTFIFNRDWYFGWGYDEFTDSEIKGSYLYTLLHSIAEDEAVTEYEKTDECKKLLDEEKSNSVYCLERFSNTLVKLIEEHENVYKEKIQKMLFAAGCHTVVWKNYPDEYNADYIRLNGLLPEEPKGYIDHINEAYKFFEDLINCPELLINFLFGDSIMYIGNDNDDTYPNLGYGDYEYVKGN